MKTEQQYDAQALKLLLSKGYDVKHALEMKDQFMHLYLKQHNSELYKAMEDGKKSSLDFYLHEEEAFYQFVKEKVNENLEYRCIHYIASRDQLMNELGYGKGTNGTNGYRNHGCYDCDGHTNTCDIYITMKLAERGHK